MAQKPYVSPAIQAAIDGDPSGAMTPDEVLMQMAAYRRKRDVRAMAYCGFLGHTFFEMVDDPKSATMNQCIAECTSLESALRLRRPGSRIYQRTGKGKYKRVA